MEEFYAMTFANCANICATFKKDLEQNGAKKENPELKIDLLHYVLDKIETVNGSVQKAMLKSIVTCLLGWQHFRSLKSIYRVSKGKVFFCIWL